MADVIDINSKRMPIMSMDELVIKTVSWDKPGLEKQAEAGSDCGGPFCALKAPPEGSKGWLLDRDTARELAIELLRWAQDVDYAEQAEDPNAG